MELPGNDRIKRIEDHGTVKVVWLEEKGVELRLNLDHQDFQQLVDGYGETWAEFVFVYNGRVVWKTKED